MITKELEGKYDEISNDVLFYQLFVIVTSGWVLAKIQKTVSKLNHRLAEKNISELFQEENLYILFQDENESS
jgi:hypothetical protein